APPRHPIGTKTPRPRFSTRLSRLGEIDMIKVLPPPREAEEHRNTAEILRDLAAQVQFGSTRNELVNLADNLDRLAAHAERRGCGNLDWSLSLAVSETSALNPGGPQPPPQGNPPEWAPRSSPPSSSRRSCAFAWIIAGDLRDQGPPR